jgi:hypothetical protein
LDIYPEFDDSGEFSTNFFYKVLKKFNWYEYKTNRTEERQNSYQLVCRRSAEIVSIQRRNICYGWKPDDFNFKIIIFSNMCSNIPASPAYGVYISPLIRYARASSNY